MKTNIFKPILVFTLLTVFNGLISLECTASENRDYFSEAKDKYSEFKNKTNDMALIQSFEAATPDGQTVNEEALTAIKGSKYRVEIKLDLPEDGQLPSGIEDAESMIIFDGTDSWMIPPFTEKEELAYPDSKKYQRDTAFWDTLIANGEMTGEEMLGNYDCILAQATDEKGEKFTLWIEKDTWNLIQAENHNEGSGKINFWNSDFRKIEGNWEIPFKQEVYVDGKLVLTSLVKSVKVNQNPADELFDPDRASLKNRGLKM